jgi:hypothetical protein
VITISDIVGRNDLDPIISKLFSVRLRLLLSSAMSMAVISTTFALMV